MHKLIICVLLSVVASRPADNNYFTFGQSKSAWLQHDLDQINKGIHELMVHVKKKEFPETGATHTVPSLIGEGVVGNRYVMYYKLSGYKKNEIHLTAKDGTLAITATRGDVTQFLFISALSDIIDLPFEWAYDGEDLTIEFPMKYNLKEKPYFSNYRIF